MSTEIRPGNEKELRSVSIDVTLNRPFGLLVLGIALMVVSCSPADFGMPRVPVREVSPNGSWVAEVRNHPSIDPPRQSLWVGAKDGEMWKIRNLAEDQESCGRIFWAADSSSVSFVVSPEGSVEVDILEQ